MAFLQRQLEYFDYSQWTWEIQEEECWGISFENPRLSGQAYFFYCGEVDYVVCYWDGPGHPRGIGESMEELRLLEVLRENSASRRSGSDFGRAGTANNGSDGSFVWSVQDPISAVAS
jgi:hypothetical protein